MYPVSKKQLPTETIELEQYELRFAQTPEELDSIYRLRYSVFNLELSEGLDASHKHGRDIDEYDPFCHHLYVTDVRSGTCVGTYRMLTQEMASAGIGFYSSGEFDLTTIPDNIIAKSVEIGRACIDAEHRTITVLHLLWKGLGIYMSHNDLQYLFGCCSLTSQNTLEGTAVYHYLQMKGHVLDSFSIQPHPANSCGDHSAERISTITARIPRLMRAYLAQGAKICGPPAIDRAFKTIDYLAFFDIENVSYGAISYYRLRG